MKKLLVGFVSLSLVLAGCLGQQRDEKQAFIDATVEATCMILKAENLLDPGLEDQAKAIYKDHGFDADNDTEMEAIAAKYENDPEVTEAINAGVEECAGDISPEDLFGGFEMEGEVTEEEATTEEEAEVTEEEATTEEEAEVTEEEAATEETTEEVTQ